MMGDGVLRYRDHRPDYFVNHWSASGSALRCEKKEAWHEREAMLTRHDAQGALFTQTQLGQLCV
jgi:hypothetical protein